MSRGLVCQCIALLQLVWSGAMVVGQTAPAPVPDDIAMAMIARGDSLQQTGMWVAALSMYQGAQERVDNPCLKANCAAGIAEVHLESDNIHEAHYATEVATDLAGQCGYPHELTLRISRLWLRLNEDVQAQSTIKAALDLHPHPALWTEKVLLAQLSGNPERTREAIATWEAHDGPSDTPLRVAQVRAAALQAQVLRDTVWLAAEEAAFETALTALTDAQHCALREQVYLVLKAQGKTLTALHWAELIQQRVAPDDLSGQTLAHLRIAHCAREAHRIDVALIGYHEAEQAARRSGDQTLLAETLRQVATFESERGNLPSALAALSQVDSLNQAMIAVLTPKAGAGRKRSFSSFVTPMRDPFDEAASDYVAAPTNRGGLDLRSNFWVWLTAIGWIGVLAFALQNRNIRQVLQRERKRLTTLRQLASVGGAPQAATHSAQPAAPLTPSPSTLLPQLDGEPVRSIQSLLEEIDAQMAAELDFEVISPRPILLSVSKSERLRDLVQKLLEMQAHKEIFGSAPVRIQVLDRDKSWQLRLSGPRISTSPSLRSLFHPMPNLSMRDELKPGAWVRDTLDALTAKLVVERGDHPGEAWVLTLPRPQV